MDIIYTLIGEEKEIRFYQMAVRSFLVFIIALVFIRFAGRRAFGMRSPFDNVVAILLGAVLGRTVTGASPFFETIGTAAVITLLHWLSGKISLYSDRFGRLVKGEAEMIYKDGLIYRERMHKHHISEKDLYEELRLNGCRENLYEIKSAWIERNGQISITKK